MARGSARRGVIREPKPKPMAKVSEVVKLAHSLRKLMNDRAMPIQARDALCRAFRECEVAAGVVACYEEPKA